MSAPGGMISARSRRLRTVGAVLLVAAAAMAIYGALVLMPGINRSIRREERVAAGVHSSERTGVSPAAHAQLRRIRRVTLVKVVFAYAYWTVCALIVIGLLLAAWLDLREVQINYLRQQRALLSEATRSLKERSQDSGNDRG